MSALCPHNISQGISLVRHMYILGEMLCGHSADIVRTYISRDIFPHDILLRFSPLEFRKGRDINSGHDFAHQLFNISFLSISVQPIIFNTYVTECRATLSTTSLLLAVSPSVRHAMQHSLISYVSYPYHTQILTGNFKPF